MRSPERMPVTQNAPRAARYGTRRGDAPVRWRLAIAAGCILALAASRAVAQCALCGSGTPYAGSSPGQAYATLVAAALVLLVPVLGLIAALAMLLRRHRD